MAGSKLVWSTFFPKFRFDMAPHSPFATGFSSSQSMTLSLLMSFHDRFVVSGRRLAADMSNEAVVNASGNLPRFPLMAVLPLPNRSYAAPMRGVMSFIDTPSIEPAGYSIAGVMKRFVPHRLGAEVVNEP